MNGARTLVVLVVVAAGTAHAQGAGGYVSGMGIGLLAINAGPGAVVAAHFAAVGAFQALRGEPGKQWVIANASIAFANLVFGCIWPAALSGYSGPSPLGIGLGAGQVALGVTNLTVALLNALLPTRGEGPGLAPVVLQGQTAGGTGRRWSGLGLAVAL